jgi:Rad3-related DNA helicase
MNRVLQAAGRVIRSETDRGVLLLMDARYTENRYRQLFPGWWQPWSVKSDAALRAELKGFWDAGAGNGPERRPLHA